MKECYIDMHCHILPGVDDGAKDLAETKKMLEIAYAEGIRCIIATPHHHPHRGKAPVEKLFSVIMSIWDQQKRRE